MRPKKKRKEQFKYIKQDNWCGQAADKRDLPKATLGGLLKPD